MKHVAPTLTALFLLFFGTAGLGQQPRTITDKGPWGDYEAFPGVCQLANGDIYVVFYAGKGHVTNPGAESPTGGMVYGTRSSDGGKTWSEPTLVVDTPEDDRDPHVAQLRDGRVVCNFFTSRYYTENGKRKRDADACLVWSSDNGETWTKNPQIIPVPYEGKQDIGHRGDDFSHRNSSSRPSYRQFAATA